MREPETKRKLILHLKHAITRPLTENMYHSLNNAVYSRCFQVNHRNQLSMLVFVPMQLNLPQGIFYIHIRGLLTIAVLLVL